LILCFLRTGKLTEDLFPWDTIKGAYSKKFKSVLKETRGRKGEYGRTLYLFGLLSNKTLPLFLSLTLGNGHHLLRSGIPSLENRLLGSCLICIKQTGSQVITKRKTGQYWNDQVPLVKFLGIKRPPRQGSSC